MAMRFRGDSAEFVPQSAAEGAAADGELRRSPRAQRPAEDRFVWSGRLHRLALSAAVSVAAFAVAGADWAGVGVGLDADDECSSAHAEECGMNALQLRRVKLDDQAFDAVRTEGSLPPLPPGMGEPYHDDDDDDDDDDDEDTQTPSSTTKTDAPPSSTTKAETPPASTTRTEVQASSTARMEAPLSSTTQAEVPPSSTAQAEAPHAFDDGSSSPASHPAQDATPTTTTALGKCLDKESCLQIIDDFLDSQPRSNGLLQVRAEKEMGGGNCGGLCQLPGPCPEGDSKCRFDTYDSALAAIYYVKRGKLKEAREILDAFVEALYPTEQAQADFAPKTTATQYKGKATGRMVTLLASSFNKAQKPKAGNYWAPFVTDGGVDTGNNAWAALAFAHYAAAANSPCHSAVAHDILGALVVAAECTGSKLKGFAGHLAPWPGLYRSVEHNVDMIGLARVLGVEEVEESARTFVMGMFGTNIGFNTTYATGTIEVGQGCDDSVKPGYAIAADATFWNILSDADPNRERVNAALQFALQTPGPGDKGHEDTQGLWVTDVDRVYEGTPREPKLSGIRFSTSGHGVQWEVTAGAVMAMIHYKAKYGATAYPGGLDKYIDAARESFKTILTMYKGIPNTVLGGNYGAWQLYSSYRDINYDYPGGSDTGLGWPYLRYLGTAPTAWAGLMLLYQADAGDAVNENANPYAVPSKPVPAAAKPADCKCLPKQAVMST